MKVAFFLNIVSPHQLPLAKEVARRVGEENFSYVYTENLHADRARMGWSANEFPKWCIHGNENTPWVLEADVLYTGLRCFDLIIKRASLGKKTLYCSERWFKPISLDLGQRCRCSLPGWLKLLSPNYFRMAMKMAALFFKYPNFRYLPIGPHAARDMRLICRLYSVLHLHLQPTLTFIPWGYFVEPTSRSSPSPKTFTFERALRVLWVGRMIRWKRVDTIIRSVKSLDSNRFALTLVGSGVNRAELEKFAGGAKNITFKNNLPIDEIRNEMRLNDVYVLASNGEEGWGAALNEAMEEGMLAFGTYEAGASASMLPTSHKFHAGDWRKLSQLLEQAAEGAVQRISIGNCTAVAAAERLLSL